MLKNTITVDVDGAEPIVIYTENDGRLVASDLGPTTLSSAMSADHTAQSTLAIPPLIDLTFADITGTRTVALPPNTRSWRLLQEAVAPVTIKPPILAATVGTTYGGTVTADGGVGPYKFSAASLPAGLTLSEAGVLTGTPTTAGTTPVVFSVIDAIGQTANTVGASFVVTQPAPPPPSTSVAPALSPVPAGYKTAKDGAVDLVWDFGNGPLPRPLALRTGVQGGTESYSLGTNVSVDQDLGALRLRALAQASNGQQWTSSYCDIGSSTPANRLPLFGRFQVMARYPFSFASWCCSWLDYKGSANNFEIDFGEMFTSQSPGTVRMQIHCPSAYERNLVRGTAYNNVTMATTTVPSATIPLKKPIVAGSARIGIQDYAFDDGSGPGAIPGHTGWHLVEVETKRIANGTGWKLGVDFFIDGKKVVSWVEPLTTLNAVPAWYQPGDDAHSWDIRWDHWIGGGGLAGTVRNGSRIYTYDGKQANGSTQYLAPVGTVPDATLWHANSQAAYYFDIAWFRVLTAA